MSDSLQSASARLLSLFLEVGKMIDVEWFGFRVVLICPKTTWPFKDSEKQQKKQRLNCQRLFRCLLWIKLTGLMITLYSIHCKLWLLTIIIGSWLACIHQLDKYMLTVNLLFHNIDTILPNFSFFKPIESLQTCISMASWHRKHAYLRSWVLFT